MKRLLIVALLLGGCASYGGTTGPFGDLSKITVADLDTAITSATAANDLPAMQCYPVLKSIVASIPAALPSTPPPGAGFVYGFEQARLLSKSVQSGVTSGQNAVIQKFNLGCAALVNDTQGDILRLGILFRP